MSRSKAQCAKIIFDVMGLDRVDSVPEVQGSANVKVALGEFSLGLLQKQGITIAEMQRYGFLTNMEHHSGESKSQNIPAINLAAVTAAAADFKVGIEKE